jgi:hypothetical protein
LRASCENRNWHSHIEEPTPEATYTAMFSPCFARQCEGRICAGHALCLDCGNGMRSPRARWVDADEPVGLQLIWR